MENKKQDIWRDSLLRYLGYTNEIGEAFRPIFPQFVIPSYLISCGYVLGDTYDKASKCQLECKDMKDSQIKTMKVAHATIDTLLWQSMASVVIPGVTINRVVKLSKVVFERYCIKQSMLLRWAPTAIGIGVIPLIVHPIDQFVDQVMDCTTRKYMEKEVLEATTSRVKKDD